MFVNRQGALVLPLAFDRLDHFGFEGHRVAVGGCADFGFDHLAVGRGRRLMPRTRNALNICPEFSVETFHTLCAKPWRICVRDIRGCDRLTKACVFCHGAGRLKKRDVFVHFRAPSIRFNEGLTLIPLETVCIELEEYKLETNFFDCAIHAVRSVPNCFASGYVTAIRKGTVQIAGLGADVSIGDRLRVLEGASGEVIEVGNESCIADFDGDLSGIKIGSIVEHLGAFAVSPDISWIGRVIDPVGRPLDGRPLLNGLTTQQSTVPDAYGRRGLGQRLDTGYAILDTMLPLVRGQRIGLFAGSGVGKSTLLAGLAKSVNADVIVLALVGERGREVRDFVSNSLGSDGMRRSVVVAATSDSSPQLRRRCAETAMAVAEYFRDQGLEVLLLVDSVTRYAEAHREICVASGEVPALRGYPASTGSVIARLCERAGPGAGDQGNITAVFSVLVAGSDMDEPVADMLRGVLDGHIVMSRDIAEAGRFPAIDVLRSVSRSLPAAATEAENQLIGEARLSLGTFAKSELMVRAGLYVSGSDQALDRAIKIQPDLENYLSTKSQDANAAFVELRRILRRR